MILKAINWKFDKSYLLPDILPVCSDISLCFLLIFSTGRLDVLGCSECVREIIHL